MPEDPPYQPDYMLVVRATDGVDFNGVHYLTGQIVQVTDDTELLQALLTAGYACNIERLQPPGGMVTVELAIQELQAKYAVENQEALKQAIDAANARAKKKDTISGEEAEKRALQEAKEAAKEAEKDK